MVSSEEGGSQVVVTLEEGEEGLVVRMHRHREAGPACCSMGQKKMSDGSSSDQGVAHLALTLFPLLNQQVI